MSAGHGPYPLLKTGELAFEHGMHCEQSFRNRLQGRMASHQVPDPPCKAILRRLADLQPEAAQYPAQAVLDIALLGLHKLAGGQYGANFLGYDRLAMDRAEPAQPHQLGDAARIVAIRLNRIRLEGGMDVPCLQKFDCKARFLHRSVKPL